MRKVELKNRKPKISKKIPGRLIRKTLPVVLLVLSGIFLRGPATAQKKQAAACRGAVLGSSDFEESLRLLSERVESLFHKMRLGGVYFIGRNDLKGVDNVYMPVLTPPTLNGEVFFNPFYYDNVFDLLAPVFRLRSSGVIIADTLVHTVKIQKSLDGKFPNREFLLYKENLPSKEKAEMQKTVSEGGAYLIVRQDQVADLDFSHIPVYISFSLSAENRIQEIAENRIQEIHAFLDSYKGRGVSNMFFLNIREDWGNKQLLSRLRKTPVNTDLKIKENGRSAHREITFKRALAHIQAWDFESKSMLEQWVQSFLRPKHFPFLSLEEWKSLWAFHSLRSNEKRAVVESPSSQNGNKPALQLRLSHRYAKVEYENFSTAELTEIESIIDGSTGLKLSPSDKKILRFRIFTSDRLSLREVSLMLGVSLSAISKREQRLLEIIQTSPLVPSDLRERIKALTVRRPLLGSWFGYSGLSDEEKAQVDIWVEEVKSRLKLTERQECFMDHYIFTDSPKTLNELASQFHLAGARSLEEWHTHFLRKLSQNEAVPLGLREVIKRRGPKGVAEENSVFHFENCSPEEKDLVALFLPEFKRQFNFTEKEIYLMDHYIFTDSRMSLQKIGKALGGIAPSQVLHSTRRIIRKLMENPAIPSEFKDILRRRSTPPRKRKRFRYSDLPEEKKPEVDEMAAVAKARLQLDEVSAYVFDNFFTENPETEKSIERRFGLKPRTVNLRKKSLLNRLKKSEVVPDKLQTLIRGERAPGEETP